MSKLVTGIVLAAAVVGCSSSSDTTDPAPLPLEVRTAEGVVRGATADGVRVFRGIPYAAPPVGPLRWKPPAPVAPWEAPREATASGAKCPQSSATSGTPIDGASEDCLFLDVYTPARAGAGEKLPVMVWIHGGAFLAGSNSDELYDASKLTAGTKAMIVSINYRLGVFGFLHHPALADESAERAAGNYGLLDQVAALEWVRRNAAAFGGDPGTVTIFGESAGAISVAFHAISPKSTGLFHRAIAQSGTVETLPIASTAEAAKQATDLGKAVGCAGADLVACLRSKPANDLLVALRYAPGAQVAGGVLQGSVKSAYYSPVVDGAFLKEDPAASYARGAMAKVPYLIGVNKTEGVILHAGILGDIPVKSADDYTKTLAITFGDAAPSIAEKYPVSAFKDVNDALARVTTLAIFTCPARRAARAIVAAGSPLFVYHLERSTQGGLASGYGPTHAAELIYLFDYDSVQTGNPGDDGRDLVSAMHGYWSAFARSGDPNGEGRAAWPRYDGAARHLVLDVPIKTGEALGAGDCDFFDPIQLRLPANYTPPSL